MYICIYIYIYIYIYILSYPPFLIPESDLTKWFDSFDHYKKSFINNSSSQA